MSRPSIDPPSAVDTARIPSTSGRELRTHWIGSFLTAGTFGTLAVLILAGHIETTSIWWDRILVGLGVLSLFLVVRAGRETLRWLRFRKVVVALNPREGSLGGDLGGTCVVPVRNGYEAPYRVFAVCTRVEPDRDSPSRKVVWTRGVRPAVERAAEGVRLSFVLPLPADLPPSDAPPGTHHSWALRLAGRLPGADLDLAFDVPVRAHEPPLESSLHATPPMSRDEEDLPGRDISVTRSAGATILSFRTGRTFGSGLMISVFGAVFLASGIFAAASTMSGFGGVFEAVFSLVGVFFLVVFGVLGSALLAFGVWRMGNGLEVEATPRRIRVTRRFLFLFARSREWPTTEIERIEAVPTGQVGDGARAEVDYQVRGLAGGGARIPLGDGIRGPWRLERVAAHLEHATGLPVEILTRSEAKKRRKGRRAASGARTAS